MLTFFQRRRSCSEYGFARTELGIILAGLVECFEIELIGEVNEEFTLITVKPEGEMRARLKSVEGW